MTDPAPPPEIGVAPDASSRPLRAPSPATIPDLLFRPRRFFQNPPSWLDAPSTIPVMAYVVGVSSALGRIETNMVRAELGNPRLGWESYGPALTESWVAFWGFVLVAAVFGAAFVAIVGAWWYRVRLGWSGARGLSLEDARAVYIPAGMISATATVLLMVLATVRYADYSEYWNSESLVDMLALVFPIWSIVVSYRGVRARFPVTTWKARLWFLILPILVFVFSVGLIGTLYAIASQG